MKRKKKAPVGLVAVLILMVGIASFFQLASMGVFRSQPTAGGAAPVADAPVETPRSDREAMEANLRAGKAAAANPPNKPLESPSGGPVSGQVPSRPAVAVNPRSGNQTAPPRPKPNDNSISGQWWEPETRAGSR